MNGRIGRVALLCVVGVLSTAGPAWSQAPKNEEQAAEVDFLIKALSNPAPRIRGNAFNRLKDQDPLPYEALVAELAHAKPLQAAAVALVMRESKKENTSLPESTQRALYAILYNPATEAWRWNITATLLSGATENSGIAVESLNKHIKLWTWGVQHPAPIIQLPSLRALQKIGEEAKPAASAVAALLERSQPPLTSLVVEPAIITHGIMGLEYAFPAYTPLTILETLVGIHADSHWMLEPLTKLTHHPSEYVALDAAAMLGKIEDAPLATRQHATHVLAQLATLPWSKVRLEAVTELGNIGEPAASELDVLIRLLKDRNDEVRLQAAVSLGQLKAAAKPALPALEEALKLAKTLDTGDPVLRISEAIAAIKEATKDDKAPTSLPALPQ